MIDWVSAIGGAIAGFSGGFTLKSIITIKKQSNTTKSSSSDDMRNVTQKGNIVGGSIAGRDINQKS